jgi:hypothetical protein
MRFILHFRPFKYLFRKNWYGIRKGKAWTYIFGETINILDLGILSIGYAIKPKKENK